MASECEASCENDPNFAVICAFMEKFGKQCGLPAIDFLELQQMLENTDEVPPALNDLILKLLRKIRKAVKPDKWEKSLVTVAHTFNSVDAWEIERFGYKKAKLTSKIRVLKEILEMQFDHNLRFKNEINKIPANELRSQPLGRDKAGHAYWFHSDENCQVRIYKEDLDDETWKLIAKDRESLVSLINKLSDGDTKFSSDSAVNEDSNSLSDKPLIDTGQSQNSNEENNKENKQEDNEDNICQKEKDDVVQEDTSKNENDDMEEDKCKQENSIIKNLEGEKENDVTENMECEKENSESATSEILTDTEPKSDEPSKPMLRIKKLSELMGSEVKRPKLDDNIVESENKVNQNDADVGETIEEPVISIEGEGSGHDNESINDRLCDRSSTFENVCQFQTSPIIGEEIEEETMYVYGEGLGRDCQTGNEETGQSNEKNGDSSVRGVSSTDSVDNSIKSTVCELKDNKELPNEVPSDKLDTIIEEKKTENKLDCLLNENATKCSEPDVRTENSESSQNENCISETKSPVPKKNIFFFGSPLKNTSFSPSAKVEFGQISPKTKEVCEVSAANGENNNEVNIKNEVKMTQMDSSALENSQASVEVLSDQSQQNDSVVTIIEKDDGKSDPIPQTTENDVTNAIDISAPDKQIVNDSVKTGKDDIETSESVAVDSKNASSEEVKTNVDEVKEIPEIKEDPCVKKVAYQCGEESKEDLNKDISKVNIDNTNNIVEEVCTKEVAYTCGEKEESNTSNEVVPDLKDKNEEEKSVEEQVLGTPSQLIIDIERPEVESKLNVKKCEATDSKKGDSQTTNKSGDIKMNKIQTLNISKTATTIRDHQLHQSLRYFRTRRTANVRPVVNPVKVDVKTDSSSLAIKKSIIGASVKTTPKPIAVASQKMATEVVYLQDRKIKGKKEREMTPVAIHKNIKKPKLTSGDVDPLSKKGDKSDAKTNSSISSPLSVTDSVITLPDSLENSSADVPDKDPLADSEIEDKIEVTKPISLRTLSFDFNESSTPPSIPDFPFTRQLRKRFRELSPQPTKSVANESKKMKFKGKRPVNTSLRKSIEAKKEQHSSSSDEVQIVSVTTPSKKSSKKKQKGKSKKQKQKKPVKSTPTFESVEISDDEEISKNVQSDKKKNKQVAKKDDELVEQSDEDSVIYIPKQRPKGKNTRILAGLEIPDEEIHPTGIRQSRRLAQIKIKEQAEPKKPEPKPHKQDKTKKKTEVKDTPVDKRKRMKEEEPIAPIVPEPQERKKKRKKEKTFRTGFDARKAWQSSSESSEAEEEVEEEEEVIEEYEPPLEFKSDHEFSPESDVASDTEYQPLKRARTARKKQDSDQEEEDFPCQKCGKSDHPEWILLCDKCDNGWHCSCLRPPLLNIPEGDWHCPPCQHILLVENLQKKLEDYDKQLNKKVLEDRRKERLAYVGISLNNVLPTRENEHRKKKRRHSFEESEESVSERSASTEPSETESDSDEPIYQLRQRRQAKSYKFNEYDELIKSAIQDEVEKVEGDKVTQSHGKDIATIINAKEEEGEDKQEAESKPEAKSKHEDIDVPDIKLKEYSDDDEPIRPVKRRGRKKGRRVNNLDISSEEDDEKDEDFKGSSSSSEEEEDLEEEESDDGSDYISGKRRKNLRPTRRSTRARVSRFDRDFINDEEDEEDDLPRKKKKRRNWSETESSETDGSWAKKKKASQHRSGQTRKRKSRKKSSLLDELSDLEIKRKPKIKYGGLTSSEEETGKRKTRGKKTTYVDTLGSDSEEERRKRNPHRYIDSDDENDEDFIANDDDEEKDSEDPPDEYKEEEGDEDQDEPQEERRALVIPKIYIKKPPVSKEILPSHVSSSKESAKPIETPSVEQEIDEKELEPVISQSNELKDANDTNNTKPPTPPKIGSITVKKVENLLDPIRKPPENVVFADTNVNKNIENLVANSVDETETKILETETLTVKTAELSAVAVEQENKRKALEEAMKLLGPSNAIEIVPIKRGRKPDEETPKTHEPIVDNVEALMHNDESNDELSEPPTVMLPMFEELASKNGTGGVRRKIGKGRPKKTIEEAVANLGGAKKDSPIKVKSESELCIEIAAPPQPFSQASPVPSVITRMLQTSPGQTTAFPVGKIRPKQFATMPADDDEPLPNRSNSGSPQTGPYSAPHMNQFLPGGPRPGTVGQPYGQMPPNMNPYPRGIHPPHQERGIRPPMTPHNMFPPHRMMDPSSSRGIPLNMPEPAPQHPPTTSAPSLKADSQNYSRPPIRYPPPSPIRGPRPPPHLINHIQQPRPTNINAYPPPHQPSIPSGPPPNYYGDYPPQESLVNEDAMPPRAYQGSPYQEEYSGDQGLEHSENSNSKSYGGDAEEGGEFGGLVSYFSSQREDDLDS